MIGKVYLIKISNKKAVPGIVLKKSEKSKYIVSQLKKPNKNEYNVVNIGKPEGLKYEAVAIAYRLFEVKETDLLKCISNVSVAIVDKILQTYKKFIVNNNLHTELHKIKKKITIAQFNNQDYEKLEKRKDQILEEIGYPITSSFHKSGDFTRLRYVPSKSIKIYYGGR